MTNIKENIAANITKYRKLMKLSQKELAEAIGVKSFTTVSSWERGGNIPDIETLFKLCAFFHISINEMYGISTDELLSEEVRQYETISNCLKEMGFTIQHQPINGHYEYIKNDSGNVIAQSKVADEYEHILIKDGYSATFSDAEFNELLSGMTETVEGKFYKKVLEQKNNH